MSMTFYICANCGEGAATWIGKCPSCGEWDSFKKQLEDNLPATQKTEKFSISDLDKVQSINKGRMSTGIFEFDRVLGGGIIRGEVILLTGEPGIGKSTLLLQSLKKLKTLYISGEESASQVKERAQRVGIDLTKFMFSDTIQVESIVEGIEQVKSKIDLLVIDSIQTIYSTKNGGPAGTVSQLRDCALQLIRTAKNTGLALILVGHVTKDGDIAGPKSLEHMVDAVITFEGDKISQNRILRSQKNRFGSTEEIGIFEMVKDGLKEVNNPLIFIDQFTEKVPGKAIAGVMEGKRPLFFEIQTLTAPTILPIPRRVVRGVDYNKVLLILAVLRKHLNISLTNLDIYLNVIGGVSVKSTSADLAIAAAIISSVKNFSIPNNHVFIGEVGLLGEIRKIGYQEKIELEARRLKMSKIYSSTSVSSIDQLSKNLSTLEK